MMKSSLSVLIGVIIEQYFNTSFCIMQYHDDPVNLVHVEYVPVMPIQGVENLHLDLHQKCKHFLVQHDNATEAFQAMEFVIQVESDDSYSHRKYMVIINSHEEFARFYACNLLTFVRDVLVIFAPDDNIDKVTGLMDDFILHDDSDEVSGAEQYDLFTHRYVGLVAYNEPILLDTWFLENGSFKFGNDLYPDKVTNVQGRELRAPCHYLTPFAVCDSDLQDPLGNELNLVVRYAERFNFTLNISDTIYGDDYGSIYWNWTGDGVFGMLISDDLDYVDIVYGGFPKRGYVDCIRSVRFTYEVSVPIPKVKYGYLMFLEVFELNVWLSILLLYLSTRGLIYIRREYIQTMPNGSRITNIKIYAFLITQSSTLSADIKASKYLKYLVMLMLFSGVLIATAYSSRLASVMVSPVYENDINSLQELAASDLKLLFFDEYYSILEEDERKVYKTLYDKIELIEDNSDYDLSEALLSSGKYAVARYKRNSGEYFEFSRHLKQMHRKYKPVSPELFTNYYYMMMRKNSMHSPELKRLEMTAEEAGLMKFWEADALREWDESLFQQEMQEYTTENENVILHLDHLKGIFAFWGCGLVISLVAFLKEVFTYHVVPFMYSNTV